MISIEEAGRPRLQSRSGSMAALTASPPLSKFVMLVYSIVGGVVAHQSAFSTTTPIPGNQRNKHADSPESHAIIDVREGQGMQQQTNDIPYSTNRLSELYDTFQRSLDERNHIQWQLSELRRLQPLHIKNFANFEDDKEQSLYNPLENFIQLSAKEIVSEIFSAPKNRKLEDAFDDLYTSTYGSNMFCGSSWAEASTSCEGRQNCPSGQSDECVMPGQECWAFTECDTRKGHGSQFSAMHGVTGGENLQGTGVGAGATGGFVDLNKPSPDKTDHYFCGKGYEDALSKCLTHCPSGSLMECPDGEICFFNTPCDARLLTKAPSPPSPTTRPTTPAPVAYASKLNKYFCGYDWTDAQERCEIWCPSGSDDDCPDDQLCFAFTKCHAVDMNGMTLEQIENNKGQAVNSGGSDNTVPAGSPGGSSAVPLSPQPTRADSVPGYYDILLGGTTRPTNKPSRRPTNKPVITAEQEMHRYSFCGAFWTDVSDINLLHCFTPIPARSVSLPSAIRFNLPFFYCEPNLFCTRQETTAKQSNTVKTTGMLI